MKHSMHKHITCPACGDLDGCHLPTKLTGTGLTLEEFWHALAAWSQATFGRDDVRGPRGPLRHLAKEVDEVLASPDDLEEYADLLFLVFDAARRAGFTYGEFVKAVNAKLKVNMARKWGKPTSDEPVEHIRD